MCGVNLAVKGVTAALEVKQQPSATCRVLVHAQMQTAQQQKYPIRFILLAGHYLEAAQTALFKAVFKVRLCRLIHSQCCDSALHHAAKALAVRWTADLEGRL
ncbi:hypothetical protein PSE10B_38250 [Pseudomonas amygdali pv. eriobotryae]|nr:hypothetical protein PSE10B_38250 [Pseudomonas amygdali pv. eriobotryae]